MPSPRIVSSRRAEAATAELNLTLAAHRRWQRTRKLDLGRLLPLISVATPQSVEHLTLPHIAAVGEAFTRGALLEASEPLVPQTNRLLEGLWASAEEQTEQWHGLERSWSAWHQITLEGQPTYELFRAVVDARNALVHGLGHLTRRQTRKDGGAKVRVSIARIGIMTSGTQLLISDDVLHKAANAAHAYIKWLDKESLGKGVRSAA